MRRWIGTAGLALACVATVARADIPVEPPAEDQIRQNLERVAEGAGQPCRVVARAQWTSQYAQPLIQRGLDPHVVECAGGARMVIAPVHSEFGSWGRGAPPPDWVAPPRPDPVVWRFR